MPLNTEAQERMFRKIKDPYTGKKVTVRVVAAGQDRPRYFSDAYDPSMPMESSEELFKMLTMRNGIIGVRTGDDALVCPYTGNTLSIVKTGDGFCAKGGFSPGTLTTDKVALARGLMMRDGVVPEDAPAAEVRVQAADNIKPEIRPADVTEPTNAAYSEAERILQKVIPPKIAVTVPAGVPAR